MNQFRAANSIAFRFSRHWLGLGLLLLAGCSQSTTPPVAIAVELLPGVLEKSFAKADQHTRALAQQLAGNVTQAKYPLAFQDLQTLAARSGLSKEQGRTLASATLTLNNLLQAASGQGDKAAAQTLQQYRQNK